MKNIFRFGSDMHRKIWYFFEMYLNITSQFMNQAVS